MVANTPRRCFGTLTFPGFELAFCHRSVPKNSCIPHTTGGFIHLLTNLRRAGFPGFMVLHFLLKNRQRRFDSGVRVFVSWTGLGLTPFLGSARGLGALLAVT